MSTLRSQPTQQTNDSSGTIPLGKGLAFCLFIASLLISQIAVSKESEKDHIKVATDPGVDATATNIDGSEDYEEDEEDYEISAFGPPGEYTIGHFGFYGIKTGQPISELLKAGKPALSKSELQTSEASFTIYKITNENQAVLGYVLPDAKQNVRLIVVTAKLASTLEGVRVGFTLAQLREYLGAVDIHGSELEGRTTVQQGNIQYVLDTALFDYEVDESKVAPETIVKEIVVLKER